MQQSPSTRVPKWAKNVLQIDAAISKQFVLAAKEIIPYSVTRYYKWIQISCNGIAWISFWIAFTWLFNHPELAEVQVNILFGLFLDIITVAVAKAYFRRRRSSNFNDNTSFPSDLILFLWTISLCFTSVLSQKHYILDVLAGVLLGFLEFVFIYVFWISEAKSLWLLSIVSDDKAIVDI